jgi:hypothetical protein
MDAAILRRPLSNVGDPHADMTPAIDLPMRAFEDGEPSRPKPGPFQQAGEFRKPTACMTYRHAAGVFGGFRKV